MASSETQAKQASLDRRLNAFRDDLADAALQGIVVAARYVSPDPALVSAAPSVPLRSRPDATAAYDTEVLFGETLEVFELSPSGWAWVKARRDDYVGYCPANALDLSDTPETPATHFVCVPRTHRYATAELKCPPLDVLTMQAELRVRGWEGKYAALDDGTYVYRTHVSAIDEPAEDIAGVALGFLETPYVWGGKTAQGLDCSALVQLAFHRCGRACPRDTDMIAAMDWPTLPANSGPEVLRRNDLVFWPGHVGIMIDESRIVHANATDMSTRVWELSRLRAHIHSIEGNTVSRILRPA